MCPQEIESEPYSFKFISICLYIVRTTSEALIWACKWAQKSVLTSVAQLPYFHCLQTTDPSNKMPEATPIHMPEIVIYHSLTSRL